MQFFFKFFRFWGEIWHFFFFFREVHPLSADDLKKIVFMISV